MSTKGPSKATLDHILTAQIAVAWAGEKGEEPRLGWWRTDLISEFGGEDVFRRLLPDTWQWAVLQATREAARRHDARCRAQEHDADRLHSIFHLGTDVDDQLDERLIDLKRSGVEPMKALPGLAGVLLPHWSQEAFVRWLGGRGSPEITAAPAGRRLRGHVPVDHASLVDHLLAALLPIAPSYPLPHVRVPA